MARKPDISTDPKYLEILREIEEVETRCDSLKKKLRAVVETNVGLGGQIVSLQTTITKLTGDNVNLTSHVGNLSAKLAEEQKQNQTLSSAVDNFSIKLAEAQKQNQSLSSELSVNTAEKESLTEQLSLCRSALEQALSDAKREQSAKTVLEKKLARFIALFGGMDSLYKDFRALATDCDQHDSDKEDVSHSAPGDGPHQSQRATTSGPSSTTTSVSIGNPPLFTFNADPVISTASGSTIQKDLPPAATQSESPGVLSDEATKALVTPAHKRDSQQQQLLANPAVNNVLVRFTQFQPAVTTPNDSSAFKPDVAATVTDPPASLPSLPPSTESAEGPQEEETVDSEVFYESNTSRTSHASRTDAYGHNGDASKAQGTSRKAVGPLEHGGPRFTASAHLREVGNNNRAAGAAESENAPTLAVSREQVVSAAVTASSASAATPEVLEAVRNAARDLDEPTASQQKVPPTPFRDEDVQIAVATPLPRSPTPRITKEHKKLSQMYQSFAEGGVMTRKELRRFERVLLDYTI
ncbi:hypothetical protein HK097_010101 [Rhizophlyctis rosea]|uniref:Uncharacterized protein n=1 Tax=Rhizophlyctis rosea TaxID=64517 RepID=A0AAD5SFY9_9FUNG|nr:hypothetical protein HK097_010101 [Rhizophlyctis rosea]